MVDTDKEIVIVDDKTIKDKIHLIRGQRVMLDADLAKIYGYETKNFNRQVKNNIEKFEGEDFMFQLTEAEVENLRCKNSTSSWGGSRYLPNAFTEQGIYMLMTVLRGARDKSEIIVFSDNVKNKDMLTKNILDDFRKDYPKVNLKIKVAGKKYHDRYIAIDYGTENEAFYLCGASSKDAGNKISSISKIEESSKDMYHMMFKAMLENRDLEI